MMFDLRDVFDQKPWWGLRGDPFLWEALREWVGKRPFPPTAPDFITMLEQGIEDICGEPLSDNPHIFVPEFDKGGMSSGLISTQFWREQGIPMLVERYEALAGGGVG